MATTITTSRPATQSSIQSSNSGIIQLDEKYFPQHGTLLQGLIHDISGNNDMTVARLDTSPLFLDLRSSELDNSGYHFPSTIGSKTSTETSFAFLADFPPTCVPFVLMKLTSAELSRQNIDSSDYTSSSKLSPQLVFNYDALSPLNKRAFNRNQIIEEIIETEHSYISSLKMLSGIYLESIISKGNNGIPIRLLRQYVDLLIVLHSDFLNDLRCLRSLSLSGLRQYETNDAIKHMVSFPSPLMSALVSELISKKALSVFLYQEYYSMIDLVLKLIDSKEDDPELGTTLTRGFQRFLESSSTEKLDLSLVSLIHKPIQRVSKYKLFLENFLKLTPIGEDETCHQKINDCLIEVDFSIKEINRYGLQEKLKTITLFNSLHFNTELKFPVEYLGLPLLLGALNVVYIINQDLVPRSKNLGAFLFKTHLVLADISSKGSKFEVVFLIPLSVSRIITNYEDIIGGIYTSYENSFKIQFENQFKIYELLILNFNGFEYSIWKEKLEILINVVNGPYKMDYSSSNFNEEQGTTSSTIIPPQIQCYDVNLNKALKKHSIRRSKGASSQDLFNQCYFQQVISLNVEVEPEQAYYYSSKRIKQPTTNLIDLRISDRTKVEYMLEDLWSEELVPASSILSRKKLKQSIITEKSKRCIEDGEKNLRSKNSLKSEGTCYSNSQYGLNKSISTHKLSLMRRTSVVFGDALRSLFNSVDDNQ